MPRRQKTSSSCFDKSVNRLQHLSLDDKKKGKKKEIKKLHLVLDLDHTLIHSTLVSQLSKKEKYLLEQADARLDLWRFNKGHSNEYIVKLRPFLHEFLLEADKHFTMHVYTMGLSTYAHTVLKLIDPEEVYFGDRVITSKESPKEKTLDLVVADKQRVVIVDDTIDVWPHDKSSLLQITKYVYFRDGDDNPKSKSYAEKKLDESSDNGSLANVLKFLQDVHKRFEKELDSQDLRPMIHDPSRLGCF
ncbi:PREDICTED: RNA polymerase II C-terminal domain phosphatase-like 4 [Camelina sativa]|uniref:RNA polymerase II C-terminal domain phosphatase-like n=1 Tax=Camelina sativa TaxID=90675 RepID=A0ABM0WBB3_CAMSA|nr:PREDICTED: RNA polymerase II C-terminal domain phosphatase-like 4 [Camelina sativa]